MTLVKKLVRSYLLWSVREAKANRYAQIYQDAYSTLREVAKVLNLTSELILTYMTEESIQKNANDLRNVYAACRQAILNAPDDQYGLQAVWEASWTFGWEKVKREMEALDNKESSEGTDPPLPN